LLGRLAAADARRGEAAEFGRIALDSDLSHGKRSKAVMGNAGDYRGL